MPESKGDESKDNDYDQLIDKVHDYCASKSFEQEFEDFVAEHAGVFLARLESKESSMDGAEQPLEFYEIYQKFLAKFEGLIEGFIEKSGYTVQGFYNVCRKILESDDELVGSRKFFILMMLSMSEYEHFYMLVMSEARVLYLQKNKK